MALSGRNVAAIERNLLPIIAFRSFHFGGCSESWGVFAVRNFLEENEVKDEMMKFNLLIRRYIELYKWIKSTWMAYQAYLVFLR